MSRNDIETLFNSAFPMVHESLEAEGGFAPFGMALATDGEVSHLMGDLAGESLPPEEIIDLLVEGVRNEVEQGDFKAAGVCFDVRAVPPGETERVDAICAQLEDATGDAMEVFLPYRRGDDGEMEYGELFGVPCEHQFFGNGTDLTEGNGNLSDEEP